MQANDYLEQKEHYTVMNVGNGVYRFYIPIWVYGRANDYYLDSYNARNGQYDSYIWYFALHQPEGCDQHDSYRPDRRTR